MPIFLLIRHGENDFVKEGRLAGRLPGVHLNKEGLHQVEILAEKLADAPIKAVYSSPLERAVETAQPIASAHSLALNLRTGLLEIDIGEWQGQKIKDLRRKKIWKTVQNIPSQMQFPGGETFVEAQSRICLELEALSILHGEKDLIVCVSHADPIKLAAAYYLGMPIDCFQRLVVSPATVTVLQITSKASRLHCINQTFSNILMKC